MSFNDEQYNKLDFLSQLTEPMIAPEVDILASLPDEYVVPAEKLKDYVYSMYVHGSYSVSARLWVTDYIKDNFYNYNVVNSIAQKYDVIVSDDFCYTLNNSELQGSVTFKKARYFEDKELLKNAVHRAINQPFSYTGPLRRNKQVATSCRKLMELMELPVKPNDKCDMYDVRVAYADKLLKNEWRIRDANLISSIYLWMWQYAVDTGDVTSPAFLNLLKLKFMLQKDLPIYSIDEVKNV